MLALACAACAGLRGENFDVLIRGGRVLDGTGTPWFGADVAVRGDKIVAVGKLRDATAATVIDAAGLYVAPGFIDGHTHAGPALAQSRTAGAEALLRQGITTAFVNPDGGGPIDLVAQRRAIEAQKPAVNVAQLVGHNSVRIAVLGNKKVLIEGTIEDMLASEEPWVKSYFRGKRARQLDLKARPKPGQPTSQQAENRV